MAALTPTSGVRAFIVGRAGGGSAIAAREQLDRPALRRPRQERLGLLAPDTVRGLALGFDGPEIVAAVTRELARHRNPLQSGVDPEALGMHEVLPLGARNHARGRVSRIPAGELLAEVSLEASVTVVAAMNRM